MYGIVNVEKFLNDKSIPEPQKSEIMARCKEHANGTTTISGGDVDKIFMDEELSQSFNNEAMGDPEHMRIGLDAMKSREL